MFSKVRQFLVPRSVSSWSLYEWLSVIFAITLQFHVTLFAQGDYLGLRVGVSDILIPFVGLWVLYSLLRRKSIFPDFSMPYFLWWLGALVIIMSAALLNGYLSLGALSSWAFINKYIGFLLLVSYTLLAGWCVCNAPSARRVLMLFVKSFSMVFVLTNLISFAGVYAQVFLPFKVWLSVYPWDGFMANRNAYMVLYVFVFTGLIWGMKNETLSVPAWCWRAFFFTQPLFFVYNDSRTGWIASGILLVVLFVKSPFARMKKILPVFFCGVAVAHGAYYLPALHEMVTSSQQVNHFLNFLASPIDEPEYVGDQARFIAVEDGLDLYRQSDVLVGAGLGAYKPFQIEKRGEYINVIDFTGLWLLVETGAIGLSVFLAFFIMCLIYIYKRGFSVQGNDFYRMVFVFLVLFAGMTLLHEFMYTRFLWFVIGLSLAAAPACDSSKQRLL